MSDLRNAAAAVAHGGWTRDGEDVVTVPLAAVHRLLAALAEPDDSLAEAMLPLSVHEHGFVPFPVQSPEQGKWPSDRRIYCPGCGEVRHVKVMADACSTCGGLGHVRIHGRPGSERQPCPACGGSGLMRPGPRR